MNRLRPILLILALAPGLLAMSPTDDEAPMLDAAVSDELDRAVQELQLDEFSKPYYASVMIFDIERVMCVARDGGIIRSVRDEARRLRLNVRVGDWSFDSGNTAFGFGSYRLRSLPTGNEYHALRRHLWLAFDQSYKSAAEALEKKRAVYNRLMATNDADVPSYTQVEPVKREVSGKLQDLESVDCRGLARDLSGVYADADDIESGRIIVSARNIEQRFVDSEGARVFEPDTTAFVDGSAFARADDGMTVKHFFSQVAHTYDELPDRSALMDEARASVEALQKTRKGSMGEYYTGPVLFAPEAAAQLLSQMLSSHLSGTPSPVSNSEGETGKFNPLAARLGRQILPKPFDVVDDPTSATVQDHPALGSYAVDHEGVPAQRVDLVEDGTLQELLMSRTPREELSESNGHGRSASRRVTAMNGNLIFRADDGMSSDRLRKRLLEEAESEGLDHGYVVRLLDNPVMTFDPIRSRRFGSSGMQPLVLVRVNADGTEEFVRGLSLNEPLIRDLEHIVAWGNRYDTTNYLVVNYSGIFYGRGTSPLPPVASSITAPALLFEELDMPARQTTFPKPPLLLAPSRE